MLVLLFPTKSFVNCKTYKKIKNQGFTFIIFLDLAVKRLILVFKKT